VKKRFVMSLCVLTTLIMMGCSPEVVVKQVPVELPLPDKNRLIPIKEGSFVSFEDEKSNSWICTDPDTFKALAVREGILANDRDIYYEIIEQNNSMVTK